MDSAFDQYVLGRAFWKIATEEIDVNPLNYVISSGFQRIIAVKQYTVSEMLLVDVDRKLSSSGILLMFENQCLQYHPVVKTSSNALEKLGASERTIRLINLRKFS